MCSDQHRYMHRTGLDFCKGITTTKGRKALITNGIHTRNNIYIHVILSTSVFRAHFLSSALFNRPCFNHDYLEPQEFMFGMCPLAVTILTALGNELYFYLFIPGGLSKVRHSSSMQSFIWKVYEINLVFQFCGGQPETF